MFHGWEGPRHHRRRRRGDVKYALLSVLVKRPMHGYDIMHEVEEASGGRYRPSPGSVYPTLQMLEDGGFVTSQVIDGKRVYEITHSGRKLFDERPDEDEEGPRGGGDWEEMRDAARKFADAMRQGFVNVDPQTRKKIRAVIDNARREIYTILAERG